VEVLGSVVDPYLQMLDEHAFAMMVRHGAIEVGRDVLPCGVRRVVFVMKGGVVYKNAARGAIPLFAGVQP
jgi:hypothetical protein